MHPSTRVALAALLLSAATVPAAAQGPVQQGRTGQRRAPAPPPSPSPRPVPAPRPPLVGSVAPGAFGPAALPPAPIGGLRTRPLNSSSTRDVRPERPYRPRRYGVYPLAVVDAPYPRAGIVVTRGAGDEVAAGTTQGSANGRLWMPTVERPRWRIDSTLVPVQAWRDIIVNDVVCDSAGAVCMEREQAVRAPWVASCRCYLFADAMGRRWIVDR